MDGPFVYFAANSEAIKIGFSTQPFIRQLQLHPQVRGLWMIGVTPGYREDEGRLHEKFSYLRVPLYGEREWFRVAPELVEFIDGMEANGSLIRWHKYARRMRIITRNPEPSRRRKSQQLLHGHFPQEAPRT